MTQTQYTIRRVPARLDQELRRRAHDEHRSLNEVALRALERGLGLAEEAPRHHDMDDLAGTWVQDPEFDRAIEAMERFDMTQALDDVSCFVTLAELRAGFRCGSRAAENERVLQRFLRRPRVGLRE